MDDKDLDALLAELRGEQRSVRERLTSYLGEESEPPAQTEPVYPADETEPTAANADVVEPAAPHDTVFPEETGAEPEEPEAHIPAEEPAPETPAQPTLRETMHRLLAEESPAQPETTETYSQRMRTRDLLVGLFLTLFAVIGVLTVLRRVVTLTSDLRKAHSQETAVMERLLPLVLMDIPDFVSPDALTDEAFLTAAIWETVTSDKLTAYPENYGMCTVPAAVITAEGNALFGCTRTPVCKTIGFTGDLRFYYDAEQDAFLLPKEPLLFTYEPKLTAFSAEEDGTYQATVDYYAEQPHWKQNAQPEPVKTVQFTVAKIGTAWQVQAAQQTAASSADL